MKKTTNYAYPQTGEVKERLNTLSNRLGVNQTYLIEEMLKKEMFYYDDITNLSPDNTKEIEELKDKQEELQQKHDEEPTDELFAKIQKLDDEIEELDEDIEPNEVYCWIEASQLNVYKDELDKANWPYIDNEFGFWIGRLDFGSAWDIYFLPALANSLNW